jgi:hypothetical protein
MGLFKQITAAWEDGKQRRVIERQLRSLTLEERSRLLFVSDYEFTWFGQGGEGDGYIIRKADRSEPDWNRALARGLGGARISTAEDTIIRNELLKQLRDDDRKRDRC